MPCNVGVWIRLITYNVFLLHILDYIFIKISLKSVSVGSESARHVIVMDSNPCGAMYT